MANARKYGDEANRLRWEAVTTEDSEHKEALIEIARLYDWLAHDTAKAARQSASVVRLTMAPSPVVSQRRPSLHRSALVLTFPGPKLRF